MAADLAKGSSRGDQKTLLGMDVGQEAAFVAFWRELPEKPSTTVRLFDRGDFFTTHGEDAIFSAKEVFRSTSVIKYIGEEPALVPSVILSRPNMESFVKNLLLVKQYRVEFWKSSAGPGKTKTGRDWVIEARASPGNMLAVEDLVFSGSNDLTSSMGLMALKPGNLGSGGKGVGVAYIDVTQRTIEVTEVVWTEPCPELEAVLIQVGPRECILPPKTQGDDISGALASMLERSGILVSEVKASEFSSKDVVSDLTRLLKFRKAEVRDAGVRPEASLSLAMGATGACLRFLQLMSDEGNFNSYKISRLSTAEFLRLDPSAITALKVLPGPRDGAATESIYGLLNKCRTPQGQRLLAQWLKQPLRDVGKLEERLDIVEIFMNDTSLQLSLRDEHLRGIPDFHRVARKFLRQQATLQDCFRVYLCLERLPGLISRLSEKGNATLNAVFVDPLKEIQRDFSKYKEMILTTVDVETASTTGEVRIKPEFDENLEEAASVMSNFEDSMKKELEIVAADLGLEAGKSVKLETNPQLGWFFRVTNKEEKAIRNNKRYSMLDATKGGVRFHSAHMQMFNDEFQEAKAKFEEAQKGVVKEIIEIAAGYSEPLSRISSVFSCLDVLLSFAVSSQSAPLPYSRPIFLKSNQTLKLVGARHPCLEAQEAVNFIPNDVDMDRDNRRFLVITGPNMGGKSTYLRSVGACCLLAQVGCFVPAKSATVPLLDAILARVGAGDCAVKGVSTFMAEMLDAAAILKSATADSLILIDELGRGTSTFDGFGLAWAISHHIAVSLRSYCLFATHFHELTALADEPDVGRAVRNLHVSAVTDQEKLVFLYEIKDGVCDESFGIHVAEMVDLPERVIQKAKMKAAELEGVSCASFSAQKLSKEERQEGEEAVMNFLKESQALVKEFEGKEAAEQEAFMRKFDGIRQKYRSIPAFRSALKVSE